MDKKEFKQFCNEEFLKRGFVKRSNGYYLYGDRDVMCAIFLQKSNCGESYYVNFDYEVAPYSSDTPSHSEADIFAGRIRVLSKNSTKEGKPFLTPAIAYQEYTAEELQLFFDDAFLNRILPPVEYGKRYILENYKALQYSILHIEEVIKKLTVQSHS